MTLFLLIININHTCIVFSPLVSSGVTASELDATGSDGVSAVLLTAAGGGISPGAGSRSGDPNSILISAEADISPLWSGAITNKSGHQT